MANPKGMATNIVKLEKIMCGFLKMAKEKRQDETMEELHKRGKWDNDNFICRGHILNGTVDSLFDVYQYMDLLRIYGNYCRVSTCQKMQQVKIFL